MTSYVISTQRSGLNWVRFNIEYHLGWRTPGKTLLISREDQPEAAFVRKHDPLRVFDVRSPRKKLRDLLLPDYRRKARQRRQRPRIDPESLGPEDHLVVLVRDPRESFVRAAHKRYSRFGIYLANLRFFNRATAGSKRIFYYEDYVRDPATMFAIMEALGLVDATQSLTPERLAEQWEETAEQSRALYQRNQRHGGGSKTRRQPHNFRFHQSKISPRERAKLDNHIRASLTPEEFALIERYFD
jgi:hypothetical protein